MLFLQNEMYCIFCPDSGNTSVSYIEKCHLDLCVNT